MISIFLGLVFLGMAFAGGFYLGADAGNWWATFSDAAELAKARAELKEAKEATVRWWERATHWETVARCNQRKVEQFQQLNELRKRKEEADRDFYHLRAATPSTN